MKKNRLSRWLQGSQKGNIQDWIVIPIVLFVIAIIAMPVLEVTQNFVPQLRTFMQGNNAPQESIDTLNRVEALNVTYDQIFVMVAIGFGLGAVISSFFIKTHPVFFFISILIFLVAMAIVPLLANVFNTTIFHYTSVDYMEKLPITSFIIENYALYLLAMFAITGILLYGKFSGGRE